MNKIIKVILILIIIQGCVGSKLPEVKSIEVANKVVLKKDGKEEFFYWEFENNDSIWNYNLGNISALNKYKDTLKFTLGEKKYKTAVRNESVQVLDTSLIGNETNGDRINALLVHTGKVGKIRTINYLESQILNYQIGRFPMFSKPTEFHAFIMRNINKDKIRVYFGASDTEWPPHPTILIKEVEKEMNNGWQLIRHLHNHYCKKDKDYIGILAPSLADAQYFKMLKEKFNIEKTLITNGFNTVEIENWEFEKFESH
jgi:hypothetical protein